MQSVWSDSVKNERLEGNLYLNGDIRTDVLVIGGGLAGVLCAYRLKQKGVSCILAEAEEIGHGTTKNTTAKITAQHGLLYSQLIRQNGLEYAKKYYAIHMAALEEYKALADEFPCDLEQKTAFVYSSNNRRKLEEEADAYKRLGIPMRFVEKPPLPLKTVGALGMEHQAQYNPMKLIVQAAKGLDIYSGVFIKEIAGNTAISTKGKITAKHIILATHFPLVNIPGLFFLKLYQHRSYAIALDNAPDVNGMYVDEKEDGYSFRNYNGLLILGGGDHRTGKKGGNFDQLRHLASRAYPHTKEKYAWATQDCMTLDSVPYIGIHRKSTPNLYVATGFNKWGMTSSMAAAMVLTDLIVNGKSDYQDIFSPQRSMLHSQLFFNIIDSVTGLLQFGKRCTHMGCALKRNSVEGTWDCHCHGSRFHDTGEVIDNPAKRGISIE